MSLAGPDLDVRGEEDELVEALPVRVTRALAAEVWSEWFVGAPCGSADPDAWFPEATAAEQVLRICQVCPLRRACLAVGILGDEHGVWGGTSRIQRTLARRRLNKGQPVAVVLAHLLDKRSASEPIRAAA